MKLHTFQKVILIKKDLSSVFDFFCNPENLNKLTPPKLSFKIISKGPVEMKAGVIFDYLLKFYGISLKWKSEITKWNPPYLFEDTQLKGPYKVWVHEHKFEKKNGYTLMTDTVNYLSPGGIFEFIPHFIFVNKNVKEIFEFRERALLEIFKN